MIHIDRDSVAKPTVLDSPKLGALRQAAATFFRRFAKARAQQRFEFEMEELHRLQESDQPYAGMARQFITRFMESLG